MNRSKARARSSTTKRTARKTSHSAGRTSNISRGFSTLGSTTQRSTSHAVASTANRRIVSSSGTTKKRATSSTAKRSFTSFSSSEIPKIDVISAPARSRKVVEIAQESPAIMASPVFKASRPTLSEVKPIKYSTGISGVPVVPNAREVLDSLYSHILELSKSYQGRNDLFFNKHIYNATEWKLKVLQKYPTDDLMVERVLGQGQLEILIQDAENDLMVLDFVNKKKTQPLDPDYLKNRAPAISKENPHAELTVWPLPEAVRRDLATEKVSIVPNHRTKPISLAWYTHLGFKPTDEQVKSYEEYMKLTPEEEERTMRNLKAGKDFLREDVESMHLSHPDHPGLDDEFWKYFETSATIHPNLVPGHDHENYNPGHL